MLNTESWVKLLRRQTTVIADLLCISGFIWKHENSIIKCEKSAYDKYVKVIVIKFAYYIKSLI